MIDNLLKTAFCLDKCICPANDALAAALIDFTRTAHRNCRQRQKGNTSPVFPLQIRYGRFCRIRILCDNISHTPAKRHINRQKITLRNADEIGNRPGNAVPPTFRRLKNGLHISPKALIAILHTLLKIKRLADTCAFQIRCPKCCLPVFDCFAKILCSHSEAISFLRYVLQFFCSKINLPQFTFKFVLHVCKKTASALIFFLLLPPILITCTYSIQSNCKFLTQPCQYVLYSNTRTLLLRQLVFPI